MRKLLALVAFVGAVACGGDKITGTTSLSGTYNLTSVNGAALPYVLNDSGPKVELVGDVFVMSAAGTFTQTTNVRFTDGTTVSTETFPDSGTYTLDGNALLFHFSSDGSAGTATVSGNTLIVGDNTLNAVYTKQ